MRTVFASAIIAMLTLPSVVLAGDLGKTVSSEDAFAWFPSCAMTSALLLFPKPDYIVSPSATTQYSYTKLSLAAVAAHVTGDRDLDGKIRICVQGGNPQNGPIVYYDNTTIFTGQWAVPKYGTGNEDIIIYGSSPARYTMLSSQAGAGVPVLALQGSSGVLSSRNIVVKDLRIIDGALPSGYGAGFYSIWSRFELEKVEVTQNTSLGGAGLGVFDSAGVIRRSKIWDNNAKGGAGGAHFDNSEVSLVQTSWFTNSGTNGGAWYSYYSDIDDVEGVYSGNTAATVSHTGIGGAVSLYYSTVRIDHSSFVDNTADGAGGAIFDRASDTQLLSVVGKTNNAGYGGFAKITGGATTLISSGAFTENTASANGGAFYFWGGSNPTFTHTVTIEDSAFDHNVALGDGGAISANQYYSVGISRSSFTSNTAMSGGAVECGDASAGSLVTSMTADAATFSANTAGVGGALFQHDNCPLAVSASSFGSNFASTGGAMYLKGQSSVDGSTFESNSAGGFGGAMYAITADASFTGSQFTFNSAVEGGAIAAIETVLSMSDFFMDANVSQAPAANVGIQGGGAILSHDSRLDLSDGSLTNNSALFDGGGILLLGSTSGLTTLTIDAIVASGNSAQKGGVVYAKNATVDSSSSVFENNAASQSGGAVVAWSSDWTSTDDQFLGNDAVFGGAVLAVGSTTDFFGLIGEGNTVSAPSATGGGGFLYAENGSDIVVTDSTISNNTADVSIGGGGGFYLHLSNLSVDGLEAIGNQCTGTNCAGGFVRSENGNIDMIHIDARQNYSQSFSGFVYANDVDMFVQNSIIASNSSSQAPSTIGIGGQQSNIVMDHVTVAGNTQTTSGSAALLMAQTSVAITDSLVVMNDGLEFFSLDPGFGIVFTDIFDVVPQTWLYPNEAAVFLASIGNQNAAPMFIGDGAVVDPRQAADPLTFDYHLQTASTLVDAGDPSVLDVDGTVSDIGAYGGPLGVW